MRIATLQFSPEVGEITRNVQQAEKVLDEAEKEGRLENLNLLVLPEMAFSGYNFASLAHITPYLEPTGSGLSTQWAIKTARRLNCVVAVGYPEIHTAAGLSSTPYNSLVFVNPDGAVVAHHRKAFLYYTDDTWAREGPDGFYQGKIQFGSRQEPTQVAAGICMDINPYKFEAPYTAYEFATHCRASAAKVVIVSMAWLTRLSHMELYGVQGDPSEKIRLLPDMDTVAYWIERFRPLLLQSGSEDEVIVVFANRAGEEGEAPIIGEVRYAGSSCVMGMTRAAAVGDTNVRIWDILGRGVNSLLVVDTEQPPRYSIRQPDAASRHGDSSDEEIRP